MKKFNGIRKAKTIVFLFLACFLSSSGIAFSDDPATPEDMVMIPGGHFLMGVDKEVNVDTEKMSKRQKFGPVRDINLGPNITPNATASFFFFFFIDVFLCAQV